MVALNVNSSRSSSHPIVVVLVVIIAVIALNVNRGNSSSSHPSHDIFCHFLCPTRPFSTYPGYMHSVDRCQWIEYLQKDFSLIIYKENEHINHFFIIPLSNKIANSCFETE